MKALITGVTEQDGSYLAELLLEKGYDGGLLNIGTGKDMTIREVAELICRTVQFKGDLVFDNSKPDGTPRKLLDVSKINKLGWKAKTSLADGINETYKDFLRRHIMRASL